MVGQNSDTQSRAAWKLAGEQHGVVTRRQLLGLGFGGRSIEHRIARGRLHPVGRGVYAVGWPQLTRDRRWMAAVLACGPGAALSHRSAASLWGIVGEENADIDVSVRRRCELRRPGLRIRGRPTLREADVTSRNWIPVTSPAQTMVDLATQLGPLDLERAINDADKRDVIHVETLRTALDRHVGRPGVRPLRILIDRLTFRLSDSDLEIFFRPIAIAAGLPQPLSKQFVNGFEVDFYWPDLGLVVETDGPRFHRTPSAQARDARRDRAHVLAGMTPLRFIHYEIRYERALVRRALARAAAMLDRRIRL
jgi:predicted transcriptional regulator of viral defense system